MISFETYKITNRFLSDLVPYILFNRSGKNSPGRCVTSYANNNICLGIVKEKKLVNDTDGIKKFIPAAGIQSYLSGMYMLPHSFEINNDFDEICIDLTPSGYYSFFSIPLKTYILEEDILTEGWGKEAVFFFESIFEIQDNSLRGKLIEDYLLTKISAQLPASLQRVLPLIHSGNYTHLRHLSDEVGFSEKKILREFYAYLDLSPKDYLRIIRFRKTLWLLKNGQDNLTGIAHRCGYYDQSHFIRDIRFFTGVSPKNLPANLYNIENDVLVTLS